MGPLFMRFPTSSSRSSERISIGGRILPAVEYRCPRAVLRDRLSVRLVRRYTRLDRFAFRDRRGAILLWYSLLI